MLAPIYYSAQYGGSTTANGDPMVFVQRPASLVLVLVIAVLLLLLVLSAFRKKREEFAD